MNTENEKETVKKTDESRVQAASAAKANAAVNDDKTIHTVNPFTGTEVTITPDDLEGVEKKLEADTERD